VNCAAFRHWLDDGRPGPDDGATAHAQRCPACAAALEADRTIERLLSQGPSAAPAGFTGRVMARVVARAAPARVPVMPAPALPWWARAARDPAAVLALAVAALLAGRWSALWAASSTAGQGAAQWVARAISAGLSAAGVAVSLPSPIRADALLGLEIGAACLALLAAPWLYRTTLRHAARAALGR